MKKGLFALLAILLLASCGGGGGGGPTPTPTSDQTKAVSQAAGSEAASATGQGVGYAFQNMQPAAMVVKEAAQNYEATIDTTNNCGQGGNVSITGNATFTCTGTESGPWNCSSIVAGMALAFADCMTSVTIGSTTYAVTLNGTANSAMTGSASGTGESLANVNYEMKFTGSPVLNVTGDITGTVDISSLVVTGTATGGADPTNTCSGTTTVVYDSTSQVCGISSDCSTCTE